MSKKYAPQERGTKRFHYITEEERKALYETAFDDNAEEGMKPEAIQTREEKRIKRREYQCQKYWLDTYGAKALSPRGTSSDVAMNRFRARQKRHRVHPDQMIGYHPELSGMPRWTDGK